MTIGVGEKKDEESIRYCGRSDMGGERDPH